MNMQLDTNEVQVAIVEYLRRRGMIVEDTQQVQLEIRNHRNARFNITGWSATWVASNVKLPEGGPYR